MLGFLCWPVGLGAESGPSNDGDQQYRDDLWVFHSRVIGHDGMTCKPCARRRKALEAKRKAKSQAGKPVQAAALGAVLAVTEVAGKALGIHGEVEDERENEAGSAVGIPGRDE